MKSVFLFKLNPTEIFVWQRESKRRYQIIKYCNKAEDTFIETSIKSENKDIQQHTDMSVHIYVWYQSPWI